jgi:hypothetical protein
VQSSLHVRMATSLNSTNTTLLDPNRWIDLLSHLLHSLFANSRT